MAKAKNKSLTGLRTWIEISRRAAKHNYKTFRKILEPKTKLWAVVKSNAYGHGLVLFSKLASELGVDGFCVDSLVEGLRLRREGIKKPVLVLGPTLPALLKDAAEKNIAVSVSNFEALKSLMAAKNPPNFHLKIDTGMHRQGFYVEELPRVIRLLNHKSPPALKLRRTGKIPNPGLGGVFTHFASAKDLNYPTYTDFQFSQFEKAIKILEAAGYDNLVKHCAATGAALIDKKYHLDAVRLGIGLYGLWPSKELETQMGARRPKFFGEGKGGINLRPILSWRTVISETKKMNAGDYIGYDLVERVARPTKIAVLPVGYWHGFPRALSGVGEVAVGGKRARALGRVSMDLLAVDVTGIDCRPGDVVTLVGKNGAIECGAEEAARKSGTSHYEFLTRINPLIERILS